MYGIKLKYEFEIFIDLDKSTNLENLKNIDDLLKNKIRELNGGRNRVNNISMKDMIIYHDTE
jgi:hypothetical protein